MEAVTLLSDAAEDLELLRLHLAASVDGAGRVVGMSGVTLAVTADAREVWIGDDVRASSVERVTTAFEQSHPSVDGLNEPLELDPVVEALRDEWGEVRREGGPHYLFGEEMKHPSAGGILRSDAVVPANVRDANPGNWQPVEWEELLAGTLGPWAMAIVAKRVVSICHTPRPLAAQSAECGVWTHPDFRGRGYASAVTSAWSDILRPSGRYLLYSTSFDNVSSQRVAQRLNLREIGIVWRLRSVPRHDSPWVHPLSRLAAKTATDDVSQQRPRAR